MGSSAVAGEAAASGRGQLVSGEAARFRDGRRRGAAEPIVKRRTGISVPARLLSLACAVGVRPLIRYWPFTVWGLRPLSVLEKLCAQLPRPADTEVQPVELDVFSGEWVRASNARGDAAVLYFHGGGFVLGGVATHRRQVAALSQRSGLPVFSVAYRQLPLVPVSG